MEVWSLASGSSGNAYLVQSGPTALLVDCGLSVRRVSEALAGCGLLPQDLSAILLTHAHSDHQLSARQLSDAAGVPLLSTEGTLSHPKLRDARLASALEPHQTLRIGEIEVYPFRVPHDCIDPVGYRFEAEGGAACILTDLGFVPQSVEAAISGVRLLVMEANHDLEMLLGGRYPERLKRRVASELGHLSNHVAAATLAESLPQPPEVVWLAHLSLVNNRPDLAVRTVTTRLRSAGLGHVQVLTAARNRPSLRWTSDPTPLQLPLL